MYLLICHQLDSFRLISTDSCNKSNNLFSHLLAWLTRSSPLRVSRDLGQDWPESLPDAPTPVKQSLHMLKTFRDTKWLYLKTIQFLQHRILFWANGDIYGYHHRWSMGVIRQLIGKTTIWKRIYDLRARFLGAGFSAPDMAWDIELTFVDNAAILR